MGKPDKGGHPELPDQKHRHARLKRKVQRRGSLFSHRDEAWDDRECEGESAQCCFNNISITAQTRCQHCPLKTTNNTFKHFLMTHHYFELSKKATHHYFKSEGSIKKSSTKETGWKQKNILKRSGLREIVVLIIIPRRKQSDHVDALLCAPL